jgi:hypothetical protein
MTWERCEGLMVSEWISDMHGMSSGLYANGYRCLLCGNLVDAMILENRQRYVEQPTL